MIVKENDKMTIKDAIKASGTYNPLTIFSIKEAEKQLTSAENVIFAMIANVAISPVQGNLKTNFVNLKDKLNGVFVVTDKRIYFCSNAINSVQCKEISLLDIQAIDDKTNVLGLSCIRIQGITDMFVIDVTKKILLTLKENLNSAIASCQHVTKTCHSTQSSYIEELENLATLLDKGIISEDEFNAKKKQLLGI